MPRIDKLRTLVVVMVLGVMAVVAQPVAEAQEASPAAGVFTEGGITFEPLAFATALALPSTGELSVSRLSLEPGSALPIEEGDPSYALGFVESGELTVVQNGPMTVTRAGALGEAVVASEEDGSFAPATEEIAAGEEVTLGAGDAGLFPPNASGEIRNDGDEPTVVLVVLSGRLCQWGRQQARPRRNERAQGRGRSRSLPHLAGGPGLWLGAAGVSAATTRGSSPGEKGVHPRSRQHAQVVSRCSISRKETPCSGGWHAICAGTPTGHRGTVARRGVTVGKGVRP